MRLLVPSVVFSMFFFLSCTDESAAEKVLLDGGYTDIQFTGHSFNSCSDDDVSCTGFIATGPTGRRVTGAVGCGHACAKACTIRLR